MVDPADSADPAASRRSRASSKRRAEAASPSSISVDTEHRLARAAQSAQRLAELSDAPRDGDTLDLFPDDRRRALALVESMSIDVRQGTLTGFELPAGVLAAVEAAHGGSSAPAGSRRAAQVKAVAREGAVDGGATEVDGAGEPVGDRAAPGANRGASSAVADDGAVREAAALDADATAYASAAGANADAAVAEARTEADTRGTRGSVARRHAAGTADDATGPADEAAGAQNEGADVHREVGEVRRVDGASPPDPGTEPGPSAEAAVSPPRATADLAHAASDRPIAAHSVPAAHASHPPSASPELEQARATAFADTVDALYGVIADQRRAAADLTRRIKGTLIVVAAALLVTVGIAVAQTLLLSRLAREAAVQQRHVEQLLQSQQATLAAVLARVAAPAPARAVAARPTPGPRASAPRRLPRAHRARSPAR